QRKKAAASSSSAPSTFPYFLNAKVVQKLSEECKAGKVERLIALMQRFEKGTSGLFLEQTPQVAASFFELMIEQMKAGKVARESAEKVALEFQKHHVYKKSPPNETAVVLCKDGKMPVNAALLSLFSTHFQEGFKPASSSSSSSSSALDQIPLDWNQDVVIYLKQCLYEGAPSIVAEIKEMQMLAHLAHLAQETHCSQVLIACIEEMRKRMKESAMTNETALEEFFNLIHPLQKNIKGLLEVQMEAIIRFLKNDMTYHLSSDHMGVLLNIEAMGLMQGDGVVARQLRTLVTGFEITDPKATEPLLAMMEWMDEKDRKCIREIQVQLPWKTIDDWKKLHKQLQLDTHFALFENVKVIGFSLLEGALFASCNNGQNLASFLEFLRQRPYYKKIEYLCLHANVDVEEGADIRCMVSAECVVELQLAPPIFFNCGIELMFEKEEPFFMNRCKNSTDELERVVSSFPGLRFYRDKHALITLADTVIMRYQRIKPPINVSKQL
ncbi:MAG TPA: hypothetical protein VN457_06415, partial [Chlamydiales bacterium]|nr:hypothetical protein [Chlamydiales bacterium]